MPPSTRPPVLEDPLASGSSERVELQLLVLVAGRDLRISCQHSSTVTCLSCTGCAQKDAQQRGSSTICPDDITTRSEAPAISTVRLEAVSLQSSASASKYGPSASTGETLARHCSWISGEFLMSVRGPVSSKQALGKCWTRNSRGMDEAGIAGQAKEEPFCRTWMVTQRTRLVASSPRDRWDGLYMLSQSSPDMSSGMAPGDTADSRSTLTCASRPRALHSLCWTEILYKR